MKNKQIYKKISKKISNKTILDEIVFCFIYDVAKNKTISKKEIKDLIKNGYDWSLINQNNQINDFVNSLKNKNEINYFLNEYKKLKNIYSQVQPFTYNFDNAISYDDLASNSDKYSSFLKAYANFGDEVIAKMDFNYSLVIEYVRDSILGVLNGK